MHRALAVLVLITAGMGWLIFRDLQVILPPPQRRKQRRPCRTLTGWDANRHRDHGVAIPSLPARRGRTARANPRQSRLKRLLLRRLRYRAPEPWISRAARPPPDRRPRSRSNGRRRKVGSAAQRSMDQGATRHAFHAAAVGGRKTRTTRQVSLAAGPSGALRDLSDPPRGATWYALAYGNYKTAPKPMRPWRRCHPIWSIEAVGANVCLGAGYDRVNVRLGQQCFAHQCAIDFTRRFAAFVDGPDDERLAAAAVAGGKYAWARWSRTCRGPPVVCCAGRTDAERSMRHAPARGSPSRAAPDRRARIFGAGKFFQRIAGPTSSLRWFGCRRACRLSPSNSLPVMQ